ncbi:MAG: hypothetical protein VYD71_00635 [Bacteroidota bacterium]|nr:hypothetical protein [Bacteroidota bacterium]
MKKVFEILKCLMLVAVIVVFMVFTLKKQEKVKCEQFDVLLLATEDHFVNNQMINELLNNKNLHPLEKRNEKISIHEMEESIINHSSIKTANVYSDIAGNISVEIRQRKVIARIINENQSYYIDEEGKDMPLSDYFTARTLVISGSVGVADKQELFKMASFINEHQFWKAQVMQIHIEENGDLVLIPRVGYHQIIFGKAKNFEEKFTNLKLFYEKGIAHKGWNNYSKINLKFKNQIVCTKK